MSARTAATGWTARVLAPLGLVDELAAPLDDASGDADVERDGTRLTVTLGGCELHGDVLTSWSSNSTSRSRRSRSATPSGQGRSAC